MTIKPPNTDVIVTTRGGVIESQHAVNAAITDASGEILFYVGDPSRLTLARSAAKPAQALAILETGAWAHYGFSNEDLALACASHSSEERHIKRAREMLRKAGVQEADLRCGGHASINEELNRKWIREGFEPGPVDNNCSGKHAGMLAGAKMLGAKVGSYHLPENAMQVNVRRVFEGLCGLQEGKELPWGIDGCNLPAPACPLFSLAGIYAQFADAADGVLEGGDEERTRHMRRIFEAMSTYPEMVGGDARYCTDLMRAYKGQVIGKVGADGCYGVGIRASEATQRLGADGAIGIAVKIEDGNLNILYSAVTEILSQLGLAGPDVRQQLASFDRSEVCNTVGVVTGYQSHLFKVKPAV